MFAVLLAAVLSFQEPQSAPQKPAPAADASAAKKALPALPDREAKAAVDTFGKAMKGASSIADKNRALDGLAEGANKLLVRPLGAVVETDKSVIVRKRAVELLALQPVGDSHPEIVRLLKSNGTQSQPAVQAALVGALAQCGYQTADWAAVGRLFGPDYAAERVPLQEAILGLAAEHKEKQSLELLLDNLDEPLPQNVDAANNPPASYWEARWKAWKAWREKVKDALFALTGQRFGAAAEAKAWLAKNPLK